MANPSRCWTIPTATTARERKTSITRSSLEPTHATCSQTPGFLMRKSASCCGPIPPLQRTERNGDEGFLCEAGSGGLVLEDGRGSRRLHVRGHHRRPVLEPCQRAGHEPFQIQTPDCTRSVDDRLHVDGIDQDARRACGVGG